MKIIIDTNIIFSSLIKEKSEIRDFILYSGEKFYTSKFCVIEIFKYKEKITELSELLEDEILKIYYKILEKITFVNEDIISNESYIKAYKLCKGIDEKDVLFVALTIELDGLLWTGDKKLIKGLLEKGFDKFYKLKSGGK